MAKLTRYDSFEELKADIQPNTLTEAERDRVYAELEKFIKLLQQDLAAKKKLSVLMDNNLINRPPSRQASRYQGRREAVRGKWL